MPTYDVDYITIHENNGLNGAPTEGMGEITYALNSIGVTVTLHDEPNVVQDIWMVPPVMEYDEDDEPTLIITDEVNNLTFHLSGTITLEVDNSDVPAASTATITLQQLLTQLTDAKLQYGNPEQVTDPEQGGGNKLGRKRRSNRKKNHVVNKLICDNCFQKYTEMGIITTNLLAPTSGGKKKYVKSTQKVRKHQGIYQKGAKKGELKPGFKYSGKKTKTGLKIIIKLKK